MARAGTLKTSKNFHKHDISIQKAAMFQNTG